ncbi:hypothetical protein K0M31_012957 [Melipona bicolor]|uniref:Uncharacterized protein n=1 Tax=Melipona bicolor TaxID=60889 RepID=A0AA40FIV1_9HYME|nr:hypothetical protein K0M31_012957 [Melipona bicolor]
MSKEEDRDRITEIRGARSPRRRITIHRRLVFREPATFTVPNIRLLIFYDLIEIAVVRIVIIAATLTIIAIIVVTTSAANSRRNCCHKEHAATRESVCNHSCCAKNSEKISTVQEQNDEELDDSVGSINHKDSLCILVEKYKKCKHKAVDAGEYRCERAKDECCDKSFTSETSCQLDEIVKQGDKYSSGNKCRSRDNRRASMGRTCRHGCGPIFREGECNQFKNLKSRLIKTGTCCSAKGTPWRHTF